MDEGQVNQLKDSIAQFLRNYRVDLDEIASKLSNLFEAVCYVLFVRHYENQGLFPQIENLTSDGFFKFRFQARGNPWNFSYVSIKQSESSEEILFEIRHNQPVMGRWVSANAKADGEPGLFALDVAVIKPGALPKLKMGTKRQTHQAYVSNIDLITFGEAKKLVAYPMLLASFYGVVHELVPEFVESPQSLPEIFLQYPHPYPALLTSNHLTPGTKNVLRTFEDRALKIAVVEEVNYAPRTTLLDRMRGIRSV